MPGASSNQTKEIRLNLRRVTMVAIPLTLGITWGCVWLAARMPQHREADVLELVLALPAFGVLVAVHESIHGVFYVWLGGVQWHQLKFGASLRQLIFYCHSPQPLLVSAYRWVTLGPLLVLGPLTLAALLVYPAFWLALATGVHLAGCIGNVWIWAKLRQCGSEQWVMDHPTEPGCDVFGLAVTPGLAPQCPDKVPG